MYEQCEIICFIQKKYEKSSFLYLHSQKQFANVGFNSTMQQIVAEFVATYEQSSKRAA